MNATSNRTRAGYAVGGGLEWPFSGAWSLKAEYQYLDFGRIGPLTAIVLTPAGVPNGISTVSKAFRDDYNTVRLGLNYRFYGGS